MYSLATGALLVSVDRYDRCADDGVYSVEPPLDDVCAPVRCVNGDPLCPCNSLDDDDEELEDWDDEEDDYEDDGSDLDDEDSWLDDDDEEDDDTWDED